MNDELLTHIKHLSSEIPHRGSTTENEKKAADYITEQLKKQGIAPETQPFKSARSGWFPFAVFSGLIVIAEAIYLSCGSTGTVIAAVILITSLVSVLLELSFSPNPFRWLLPKGHSQNVIARLPAAESSRNRVVISAHMDSHRTPLAFSTDSWVKVFKKLIPIGLFSTIVLLIIFTAGIFSDSKLLKFISQPFALVLLLIFLITAQADFTPFAPGANDNASGVAAALVLAQKLQEKPLKSTDVWIVFTGCEEVGCYGAEAFARKHREKLGNAFWITLDNIGSRDAYPAYLLKETFLLTFKSDSELVEYASNISVNHPELDVRSYNYQGAYTEQSIAGKYGFRPITLMSFKKDGSLPDWHRPTDTYDRVDTGTISKVLTFLDLLLERIDRR